MQTGTRECLRQSDRLRWLEVASYCTDEVQIKYVAQRMGKTMFSRPVLHGLMSFVFV
jgi:hypothetical protein